MNRQSETFQSGNRGTSLAARFRFRVVEELVTIREQERITTLPGRKLKFWRPEQVYPPSCPLCDHDMKLDHRASGIEWACCLRCGYADDVPGFTARMLHCTLREAIDFLVYQHNMHKVTEQEIRRYLEDRVRYERFASCLRERLFTRRVNINNKITVITNGISGNDDQSAGATVAMSPMPHRFT